MPHRLEILNIRDRYMIGDWVLNNGKPYQWTADDYNRSKMGMEAIKPMPLTEDILKTNGFEHQLSMNNVDHGWTLGKLWLTKDLELFVYKVHVKLSYVHELQSALRTCNIYHLAENFKV